MKFESRTKLILYFSTWIAPSITEALFYSPSLGVNSCLVRGRLVGPDSLPLQWSKAVKGLCIFALYAKKQIPFEGGRGSYASALDLAIGKGTRWLADLFGSNSKGLCNIRRIVRRKNPELKSGEVCSLSLNEGLLSHHDIEIFVGNEKLTEIAQIDRLLASLFKEDGGIEAEDLTSSRWREFLFNIYFKELHRSFQWRTPFSSNLRLNYFKSLKQNPAVQKLFPLNTKLGDEALNELMSSHPNDVNENTNWQLLKQELASLGRPLKLVMSAPGCPLVLTSYLKMLGFSIESDWQYTHAGYVADQIAASKIEGVDGFYAALTPSLAFIVRDRLKKFVPVCILPQTNHSIVSNTKIEGRKGVKETFRKTILLGKEVTSAHLVHSELKIRGQWSSASDYLGEDPDVVAYHLKEDPEPLNAIMFFPFCDIVSDLGDFRCQSATDAPSVSQPFILFLNRDIPNFEKIKRTLQIAFKFAWLELSGSKTQLTKAVDEYLSIEGLPEYLAKISGASALKGYEKYF